jgi:hypothetical protein
MVGGLGFAALRGLGAFPRNSTQDDSGAPSPVCRKDNVAVLEGSSQSGRMIRSFLALGSNVDQNGGRGRLRLSSHWRAPHASQCPLRQPVRAWGEQTDRLYPAYDFPFSCASQSRPHPRPARPMFGDPTLPAHLHVATALETREGRQSLGLTDPLGQRDIDDPPNARTLIMASAQHGAASMPLADQRVGRQLPAAAQLWTMRALLSALPASARPRIDGGTLVPADQVRFPEIPANA